METVHSDLKKYLKKYIFPSRTVLVFPPFNGFRRFLIHKLIEDNFSSSDVAAFSIGVDISRRIVVCYKGLIREGQAKGTPGAVPQKAGFSMIEKEKQKRQNLTPTAAVYRPPAARLADSRRTAEDTRPPDSKRNRIRRPDLQVYVPRPKRASFGNEQPRSRSRSSSRTSLDSDSCDKRNGSSPNKSERPRLNQSNEAISDLTSHKYKTEPATRLPNSLEPTPDNIPSCSLNISASSSTTDVPAAENNVELIRPTEIPISCNDLTETSQHNPVASCDDVSEKVLPTIAVSEEDALNITKIQQSETFGSSSVSECVETKSANKKPKDCPRTDTNIAIKNYESSNESDVEIDESPVRADSEVTSKMDKASEQAEDRCLKTDAMETISISSDSRDQSSNSFTTFSSDSKSSESSSDSEVMQKRCRRRSYEQMEIEHSIKENKKESNTDRSSSQEQNLKNRRIFPSLPVSDVLIISDTSSSDEPTNISKEHVSRAEKEEGKSRKPPAVVKGKSEINVKSNKEVDPDECDWESLYDDSGECLVPDLMEELTNSVGRVRVTSVDSDYRPYQSIEERTNDGECVIEIYDFPAEFKTTDLFNIFAAYRSKSFQIKWVDDTHALGVFPSPLMADEVLACTLPFVKTRPLRLGIAESRNKARNLVLPPLPSMERPKTCTALARRLVSGALGLRLPTSSQEREKEKQVLKEAREKRRLEAKQREAAWDGTLTSGSCI